MAKKGTKRIVLTDGKDIQLSVVVDGANRHDKKLVKRTLDAMFFERHSPEDIIQNICMAKDYDPPISENWLKNMVILRISKVVEKKT